MSIPTTQPTQFMEVRYVVDDTGLRRQAFIQNIIDTNGNVDLYIFADTNGNDGIDPFQHNIPYSLTLTDRCTWHYIADEH